MAYAQGALAFSPLKTDDTGTESQGNGKINITGSYEYDDADGQETSTIKPNAELIYGLSDTLDIGIGQPYKFKRKKIEGLVSRNEGKADTEVELKWRFMSGTNSA